MLRRLILPRVLLCGVAVLLSLAPIVQPAPIGGAPHGRVGQPFGTMVHGPAVERGPDARLLKRPAPASGQTSAVVGGESAEEEWRLAPHVTWAAVVVGGASLRSRRPLSRAPRAPPV